MILLTAILALGYGALHLLWYWQTPLGMSPALDERENIDLAFRIAGGTLPREPFYRAMGYPLLLAVFPSLGASAETMPFIATAVGVLLHGLSAALVCAITMKVFASRTAARISGIVCAIHPVLVYYATQVLDGALANAAFLGGLFFLLPPSSNAPLRVVATRRRDASAAMGLWTAAALIRPQFFVLLPLFPFAWILLRPETLARHLKPFACAATTMAAMLLLTGVWQWRVCGEFRIMPTQGPYNMWIANRPGADGRYFSQSIHVPLTEAHQNPARVESRVLYEMETGRPAGSIDEENAHWSRKLRIALAEDPLRWAGLLARKTYYLLNDFDAYNNKTYSFHKARSPWLARNPLGWGLVLVAAAIGYAVILAADRRAGLGIFLIVIVVAGGLVLTLVSGRFRLPLLSLGCVLAGGAVLGIRLSKARLAGVAVVAAGLAVISFSNWAGAKSTATYVQDHLLIAQASLRTADDLGAWRESGLALDLRPDHPDALAGRVAAGFNLMLAPTLPPDFEMAEWREAAARLLRVSTPQDPHLLAVAVLGGGSIAPQATGDAMPLLSEPLQHAVEILSGKPPGRTDASDEIPADAGEPPLIRLARAARNERRPGADAHEADKEISERLRERLRAPRTIKDHPAKAPEDKTSDSDPRPGSS